jgi:hypothetical protein
MNSNDASQCILPANSCCGFLDISKSLDFWRLLGVSRENLETYGHLPTFQVQVGDRNSEEDSQLLCAGVGAVVTTVSAKAAARSARISKMTRWRVVPLDSNALLIPNKKEKTGSAESICERNDGSRVALMNSFGMFLGHALAGLIVLTASSVIRDPQVYGMVQHQDGSVSFLGSTGRFLTARSEKGCCAGCPSSLLSRPVGLLKDNHFHVDITRWSLIQAPESPRYDTESTKPLPACQEAAAQLRPSTRW